MGLLPTLPTPLRFLSQVLYFRAMVGLFGLNPLPFHLVTLSLHLANTGLVFLVARLAGASPRVAGLSGLLFGCFPLAVPLLSSAAGVNDELALALTLLALVALTRAGSWWLLAASVSFTLAMLCKESVMFLPILALLLPRPLESLGSAWKRPVPLFCIAALFGGMFLVLRPIGLAPGGTVYSVRPGFNVFHNLMTYTSWAVDLRHPIPDMVASYSTQAWRVGAGVLGLVVIVLFRCAGLRRIVRIGLLWWLLGLLPVLALRFQTYRHYMYPAIPGLALVAACSVDCILSRFVGLFSRAQLRTPEGGSRPRDRVFSGVPRLLFVVLAFAYAARADQLIEERFRARVPGTNVALDPVLRRQEVTAKALASFRQFLGPGPARAVVFTPEGVGKVFGTRSGRNICRQLCGVAHTTFLKRRWTMGERFASSFRSWTQWRS